ncbi:HSP90 [Ecytonucleospora hepatopenaei]|uniref:HSP90 n=1 Tax=Ecytonucleospora hepatopenaei TaxID=646526 RepID=A0A1W0E7T2_9MICR|nr:HSP90 [Ecytonucleospora hepatopenaei]
MQKTTNKNEETFEFGVEVPQLMSMFINSVYSSKDMFLREAVSNASDAITKFVGIKSELDGEGYSTHMYSDLKIEIIPDKENKTLIIRDNGIGMTKDDLKNFLGNIAASGTAKFREALATNKESVESLIGQFGLGFYSLFLVAEQVDLISKNPRDKAYFWSSKGQTGYSIKEYEEDLSFSHGTSIFLRLKEGEEAYLSSEKLIELVKKHSMYIKYPIFVESEVKVKKEAKKENKDEVEEVKEENENKDNKEEKKDVEEVEETVKEMKVVNNSEVNVWKKKVSEVSKEDLQKFYTHISGDTNEFLAVESFQFQGLVEVKLLLFIPSKQRMNFFIKQEEKAKNIKIYNNNVFITDSLPRDVVPEWMDFMYGAVTSSDFSLNISREFLQGKTALKILKSKLPKSIASMIKECMKDEKKAETITAEFAKNIKMAVQTTTDNTQEEFAKFLRYYTNQEKKLIGLDEYMNLIGEEEKQILYLTALNQKDIENSIFLDAYKDKHVLLMTDASDEIMMQGFKQYKGMDLQNISVENSGAEEPMPEFDEFKKKIAEVLKEKVEKVVVSKRYKSLPATLLTQKFGYSSTMESIIKFNSNVENNMMYQMMLGMKKVLEVNPENEFIQKIKAEFDAGNEEKTVELINFMYQATVVGCGYPSDNTTGFIRKLFELI